MTDTPRKKLSISRKPKPATAANAADSEKGTGSDNDKPVRRSGKRRIVNTTAKPSTKPSHDKAKKRPPRKNKKKALVSPSDLRAQALDKRLSDFDVWSNYKPLTLGIDKAIFRLVNDEAFEGGSKKVVQKLLRMHTNHARYLQAMSRGGLRYQLDGTPAETISDYQKQHAIDAQAKRAGRAPK